MNKNVIRTIFVNFILLLGVCFINMDNVEAEGYAYCVYQWNPTGHYADEFSTTDYNYYYRFSFKMYRNSSGDLVFEPSMECSTERGNTCTFRNQSDYERDIKKYYNDRRDSSWDCPSSIHYDYDGGGPFENFSQVNICYSWHLLCRTKVLLTEDKSSNTGSSDDSEELDELPDGTGTTIYTNPTDPNQGNDSNHYGTGYANGISNANNIDFAQIEGGIVNPRDSETGTTNSCDLIPTSIRDFLKNLFLIIQVIGVILMIVLTLIEFIKAVTASEEDGLKGAFKNSIRRIIATVILLILPMIIVWVINVVNDTYSDKHTKIGEDGNPTCIK